MGDAHIIDNATARAAHVGLCALSHILAGGIFHNDMDRLLAKP
jgi:hypothetical protein